MQLEISATDKFNKNYIAQEYLAGKSCTDIALELGRTFPTILYHLERSGIKRRSKQESWTLEKRQKQQRRYIGAGNPCFGRKRPEKERQRISEATKAKVTPEIRLYLSVLAQERLGSLGNNWKGGVWRLNWYPYEFDQAKYLTRERDGHICQFCHSGPNGREHDVHHIDGDAFNNELENLVTLCRSCHKNVENGNL